MNMKRREFSRAAAGVALIASVAPIAQAQPAKPVAGKDYQALDQRAAVEAPAGKIEEIGDFYLAPGYSTEFMHVYLAQDLRHDPLEADADEFLSVEKIPFAEAVQMAERGEMPDAKSLAALLLARSHLK